MTIDEAIEDFKYCAEQNRTDFDITYAEENEQIAEWLEELKAMRNLDKTNYSDGYKQGRKDAIEEMLSTIHTTWLFRGNDAKAYREEIDYIAEKLKENNNERPS